MIPAVIMLRGIHTFDWSQPKLTWMYLLLGMNTEPSNQETFARVAPCTYMMSASTAAAQTQHMGQVAKCSLSQITDQSVSPCIISSRLLIELEMEIYRIAAAEKSSVSVTRG